MTNENSMSKNARRQHARETARLRREAEKKRRARNRALLQGGIALGIVAIAAATILIVVNVNAGAGAASTSVAGPKNMITNGIAFDGVDGKPQPVLSAGVAPGATPEPVTATNPDGSTKVVTYIDWACPSCKQFEATYSSQILDLVAKGKATLEVHPVSILDRSYQSSRYASRAANAAACVANYDPAHFLAVQNKFYDHQPQEGSDGLTNEQIKGLITAGGVSDPSVSRCVDRESFKSWVTASTNQVLANPALTNPSSNGFGTPTVIINGKMWNRSSDLISLIAGD